jgi:uncharacterized protein
MKHVYRVITHWALLIHIYVSMTGFLLVLLFALSGLVLNHQDSGLASPQTTKSTISVPPEILEHPDRETITAHLRSMIGVKSPVTRFTEHPDEIEVIFTAPGYRTEVFIDRIDGTAEVDLVNRGVLGKMNDLHKGLDTGRVWPWVIDIAAVLLSISSITGMVTLLSLRARRRSGFIVGGLAILVTIAAYFVWVPQ